MYNVPDFEAQLLDMCWTNLVQFLLAVVPRISRALANVREGKQTQHLSLIQFIVYQGIYKQKFGKRILIGFPLSFSEETGLNVAVFLFYPIPLFPSVSSAAECPAFVCNVVIIRVLSSRWKK